MKALLRPAWQRLTLRFLLLQIALAVVAFALFAAWLRVPDGTVFAVAASALLALIFLVITFAGEAWLLLRQRGASITLRALLRGAIALLVAMALMYPLSVLITHASAGDALRAGYFNSHFSASLRNTFSYAHFMTFFKRAWDSLFCAGLIVFSMAAVGITAARRPRPAFRRMLRSLTAWIVLSLATVIGSEATLWLLHWTPGHGLTLEATSLVFRLVTVVLLDAFLLCLSLALLVVLCEESDAHQLPAATVAGTPVLSHPRTVENP